MPHNLKDRLRDQFSRLKQGSITITEYEAHFHELSKYETSILDTKYERVRCFVRGLRLPIRMATQSLVVIGRTFAKVSEHAKVMKEIHRESREGHDKRPRFQGRFGGSHGSSRFRSGISYVRHPLHLFCHPQS